MASTSAELSAPAERAAQHFRNYQFGGYRRADGLFDIEGRMTDAKSYAFPNDWRETIEAGEPIHDMRIRLTLDEAFVIQEVECVTAAGPYEICPAITPAFAALKGERVGRGWSRILREKFGGRHGCVHHVEMLRAMATVAFQTLYGWQGRRKREAGVGRGEGRLIATPPAAANQASSTPATRWPATARSCARNFRSSSRQGSSCQPSYYSVTPAKRSASRGPWGLTVAQMDRMGLGSAPLRGLAGMTWRAGAL